MIRKLMEEYEKWELIVNTQETKYPWIEAEAENLVMEANKEYIWN